MSEAGTCATQAIARGYLDDLHALLAQIDARALAPVVRRLRAARHRGATIYLAGNGGSAATAAHLAKAAAPAPSRSGCCTPSTPIAASGWRRGSWPRRRRRSRSWAGRSASRISTRRRHGAAPERPLRPPGGAVRELPPVLDRPPAQRRRGAERAEGQHPGQDGASAPDARSGAGAARGPARGGHHAGHRILPSLELYKDCLAMVPRLSALAFTARQRYRRGALGTH